MRALRAVFLLNGAALGVFYPFIAVILDDRGVSPEGIGLITAASSAAFSLAVPAWGHIADVDPGTPAGPGRRGRRLCGVRPDRRRPVPLVVMSLGFVGFSLFESAWGPLGDALAVNAITNHGREYGRIRLLSSVGFAVVATLAGFLYNVTGYGPAFALCAGLAVLLGLAALRAPDVDRADLERVDRRPRAGRLVRRRAADPAPALACPPGDPPRPHRHHRRLHLPAPAPPRARRRPLGRGPAGGRVRLRGDPGDARRRLRSPRGSGSAASSPPASSSTRRASPRGSSSTARSLIVATRVATGFSFAGLWVGSVLTMAVLLPPRLQATGQGLYQLTGFGLAAVLANVVGGLLYGAFGSEIVFVARHAPRARRGRPGLRGLPADRGAGRA